MVEQVVNGVTIDGVDLVDGDIVYLEFRASPNVAWQRFKYDSSNANSLGITAITDISADAQFEYNWESGNNYGMTFRSIAASGNQRLRMKADTYGLRIQGYSSWETEIISFNINGNTLKNYGRSKCLYQFSNNEYRGINCGSSTAEARVVPQKIVYLEFRINSNAVWQRFKYDSSKANDIGSTSISDVSNAAKFEYIWDSTNNYGMTFRSIAATGDQRIRMRADNYILRIQGYSSWEFGIISYNYNGKTLKNHDRNKCLLQVNGDEYKGVDCGTTTAEVRIVPPIPGISPTYTPTAVPSKYPTGSPTKKPTVTNIVYLEFRLDANSEWQRFKYDSSKAMSIGSTSISDVSNEAKFEYIWDSTNNYGMTFRSVAATGDQRIRMRADNYILRIQGYSSWEFGIISYNYNGKTLKNYDRNKCLLQVNGDEFAGVDCGTTTAEVRIVPPIPGISPTSNPSSNPTAAPSKYPSKYPTGSPTKNPTHLALVDGVIVYLEFRASSSGAWQRFKYDSSKANSIGSTSTSDVSNDAKFEYLWDSANNYGMTFRSIAATGDQRIRMRADNYILRIQGFSSWEFGIISYNYNGKTLKNYERNKCLLQVNGDEYKGVDCGTTTAEVRIVPTSDQTKSPTGVPSKYPTGSPTKKPTNLVINGVDITDGGIVYLEFRMDANSEWQRFKYDTTNANSLGTTNTLDTTNEAKFVFLWDGDRMTFKSNAASGNQRIRMKADTYGLRIQGYSSWETDIISWKYYNDKTLINVGRSKCLLKFNNNEYQGIACGTSTAEFRIVPHQTRGPTASPTKDSATSASTTTGATTTGFYPGNKPNLSGCNQIYASFVFWIYVSIFCVVFV